MIDGLAILENWFKLGWITALDRAFVHFLRAQNLDAHGLTLMGAALVSHQLGRGHVCLDLASVSQDPDKTLALPPEGAVLEDSSLRPAIVFKGITPSMWADVLNRSEWVGPGKGDSPLVLDSGRLYLRRYWQYGQEVVQGIRAKCDLKFDVPSDLADRLTDFFAPLRSEREKTFQTIDWQTVAAAVALRSGFTVISGGPGTGKTTTVVQLLGVIQSLSLAQGQTLRILLAAPTGKAAARLAESIRQAIKWLPSIIQPHIPAEVVTLHRLLGRRIHTRHFLHTQVNPLHVDLLIVDEASMIDIELMAALLNALPSQARIILLGDKDQLASVEAGSVLGDICQDAESSSYSNETIGWLEAHTGYSLEAFKGKGSRLAQHIVVLRKSHRFGADSGIGILARGVHTGDLPLIASIWEKGFPDITRLKLNCLDEASFRYLVLNGGPFTTTEHVDSAGRKGGFGAYLHRIRRGPRKGESEEDWLKDVLNQFNGFQLLAPLRNGPFGVDALNERAAMILYGAGIIESFTGWYSGRPVMMTRNDYGLGLMNGDRGILIDVADPLSGDRKVLRVVFPMADGSLKKILPSRLLHVETAYAMTVHKSQGSEFDHAVLMLPDTLSRVLTRELVYTGITRARFFLTLAGPRPNILKQSVQMRIQRASGLGEALHRDAI